MPAPVLRLLVCCLGCAVAAAPAMAVERAALHAALNSIQAPQLQEHVNVLADDQFEGREAGTRGGRAAGGYLVQHLQKCGLAGAADGGGFVQTFDGGYRNLLGLLEGSDPALKHEIIVIGAHYDHVGYGNQSNSFGPFGYVHNGADDNASGVAGLLEVIDAFALLPERPRRSILFALWDGEEKGLLGSQHWTSYPTLPLQNVVFAINLDMIGRLKDQRLDVYGTRSGSGLRRLVAERNSETGLTLNFSWELKSNSDHYPFFSRNIPVLMFHTGLHDDYHRPSDDAHLVNAEGMQTVARLIFHTLHELADGESVPQFRSAAQHETPADRDLLEEALPAAPPRLGIRWDEESVVAEKGLLLTHVEPGSAAEQAGLRPGDRLVQFAGQAIEDSDAFRVRVLASESPVEVQIVRDQQPPETRQVHLAGNPTRVGISWRDDDGEPGTVILSRVLHGSPADRAGMAAGDRVYAINGRRFNGSSDFFEQIVGASGPLRLLIERQGRLNEVELSVLPSPDSI